MTEENLSLEVLVKDLASTAKNLQEEISGLKKDKEEAVSAPRWKKKCSHDNEDVGELESDTETYHTRNGYSRSCTLID